MFVEGKPRTVFFPPDTLFTTFVATVQKIITYALGAHDPGSAQDGRTSNDFCTPEVWRSTAFSTAVPPLPALGGGTAHSTAQHTAEARS